MMGPKGNKWCGSKGKVLLTKKEISSPQKIRDRDESPLLRTFYYRAHQNGSVIKTEKVWKKGEAPSSSSTYYVLKQRNIRQRKARRQGKHFSLVLEKALTKANTHEGGGGNYERKGVIPSESYHSRVRPGRKRGSISPQRL